MQRTESDPGQVFAGAEAPCLILIAFLPCGRPYYITAALEPIMTFQAHARSPDVDGKCFSMIAHYSLSGYLMLRTGVSLTSAHRVSSVISLT